MKGLLKKEFYYCKWYLLLFLIIYIIIAASALITSLLSSIETYTSYEFFLSNFYTSQMTLFYILSIIPVTSLSTSFAFDERSNFDKFILASGVKRDTVITTKYLFAILTSIIPITLFIVVSIICFIHPNVNAIWNPLYMISVIIAYVTSTIFITTFNIMIMSRFGQMKQTVISSILYIILIFAIAVYLAIALNVFESVEEIYDSYLQSIVTTSVVGVILLVLSAAFVFYTYYGYRRKEF